MSLQGRILGCLVGGAIGDAVGGVPDRGDLSLSDDTQLTLATREALIDGQVLPEMIAAAFVRWFRSGAVTGVGSSTLKALRDLSAGAHWALSGARGEMAAGNGAVMRIAPLAFRIDPLDPGHRVTLRDVCRVTHHSDEAYLGALAVVLAIRRENGLSSPSLFQELAESLPDSRVRDWLVLFEDLAPETPLTEVIRRFGSSGYVVETVSLALFLARRMTEETFAAGLDELVEAAGIRTRLGRSPGRWRARIWGSPGCLGILSLWGPVRRFSDWRRRLRGAFPASGGRRALEACFITP